MTTAATRDIRSWSYEIGKARVFFATATDSGTDLDPIKWDGTTPLYLKELGLLEGEPTWSPNGETNPLTLPEYLGPAPIKVNYTGEAPVLELPMYLADPALLSIVSPTGGPGAGYESQQPVARRTLVVFPEALFRNDAGGPLLSLTYTTADGWEVGGVAVTAEQERLLGLSLWLWSGFFSRPAIPFRFGDGGKALTSTEFSVIADLDLDFPEGSWLYWIGDPADAAIDIDPAPPTPPE
jgi:hypothetical protein